VRKKSLRNRNARRQNMTIGRTILVRILISDVEGGAVLAANGDREIRFL